LAIRCRFAEDNRLAGITYLNPVNPTPNVSFAYDPYFPRRTSMTDGTGTTQYSYVPIGTLGALKLKQETPPLASSAIAYAYDALGRLASRTVAGAGAESFGYDAIGRLTSNTDDLGAFSLAYLGQTGQIAQRNLPSPSTLSTSWGYLPNSGDRRLASIANTGLAAGQFSNFTFATTAENFITGITESSDAATVYPPTGAQTASYNNLNQLTNLSGQALTWDADGELLSDGTRSYAWDAENRLVAITYPARPGEQTSFAYDGLSRRTAITSIAGVTTSYLWCGSRICQARDAGNATTREYYAEGEYVPGSPAQPYYYGPDQLGTARRVFASTSSAPAYAYDPYGQPLQATAPLTDFTYAGMFYNADSGLYLTQYRAYDPVAGRWLSRDPIGEPSDPAANLYRYVKGEPVALWDPSGLGWRGALVGGVIGAALGAVGTAPEGGVGALPGALRGAELGSALENLFFPPNPPNCPPASNASTNPNPAASAPPDPSPSDPSAAEAPQPPAPDGNKLHHIFDNPEHNLAPVVQQYGGQEAAYDAIQQAVIQQRPGTGSGTYDTVVNVGGSDVTVTGSYVNGIPRVGTAYIP